MLAPVVTFDERDCWPGGGMRGETQLMHAVRKKGWMRGETQLMHAVRKKGWPGPRGLPLPARLIDAAEDGCK
ncbi:hypothetical protein [Paraburkholderia sp. GAS348]|uniref:hypothetical protein n=1 Tax=Paraburkholderia sp. GAS348 TaxID=3035132 RepID=UPI003D20BD3B